MREGSIRVFLSAGAKDKRTEDQDQFVSALRSLLSHSGFEVRTADWSSVSPLAKIREEMKECDGAVIVAFERIYAKEGLERAESQTVKKLVDLRITTVWDQVEAAMAYCLELPLLIVCEPDLRQEAILEKYDWYVHRTLLSKKTVQEEQFDGIFTDWAGRVKARHQTAINTSGSRQKSTKQSNDLLTVDLPRFWGFLTVIGALLIAAFFAGSKWPGLAEVIRAMSPH
jgi:hypothetical protein